LDQRARKRAARGIPGPRVYFEIWPQPLQAAGPGSLLGHLIQRSGGTNVISSGVMPLISAEAVIRENPQIIFHTGWLNNDRLASRPGWSATEASKTMRVLNMDPDLFCRAGPRVLEAWALLDTLLYKEAR
jgi:iron complex transport system substrate-binding protein